MGGWVGVGRPPPPPPLISKLVLKPFRGIGCLFDHFGDFRSLPPRKLINFTLSEKVQGRLETGSCWSTFVQPSYFLM